MVESGSLGEPPLTNVAELRQEKSYLKARKRCWEIAGWVTVGYMQGTRIAVVLKMVCSRLVWEEGAHRKYPGRAKVPVEALARLAVGNCSIAAAAAVDVAVDVEPAAAAVLVVAAVLVADVEGQE